MDLPRGLAYLGCRRAGRGVPVRAHEKRETHMGLFRGRRAHIIVASVCATAVAGGIATAAIPDGTGTIHACYKKVGGALSISDNGTCGTGETAILWSQQGP